jgi:hypothetical protein
VANCCSLGAVASAEGQVVLALNSVGSLPVDRANGPFRSGVLAKFALRSASPYAKGLIRMIRKGGRVVQGTSLEIQFRSSLPVIVGAQTSYFIGVSAPQPHRLYRLISACPYALGANCGAKKCLGTNPNRERPRRAARAEVAILTPDDWGVWAPGAFPRLPALPLVPDSPVSPPAGPRRKS